MKGKVILIPIGGLANRMRVIASTARMTEENGGNMSVIWNVNDWLGCESRALFTLEGIEIRDRNDRGLSHVMNLISSKTWNLRGVRYYGNKSIYENTVGIPEEVYRANLTGIMDYDGDLCFETDAGFYWGRNWSIFNWNREIVERAQKVMDKCGGKGNYVSMHIRRTDHLAAIKDSPDQLFIDKLNRLFEDNENERVFLATDSPELEKKIRDMFGMDRIFTCENKPLSRGDSEAIIAAAVDLLCLSGGKRVYGSYGSSFAETAAHLSGIECENLRLDR